MKTKLLLAITTTLAISSSALGLEQIVKSYQSPRSSGMGGVKLTTGLYDENYFGNPARVTANPEWRVTILDPMIELNSSSLSNISKLTGGGDTIQQVADTAGKNQHVRVQTTMPSVYIPTGDDGKWAFAVGLIHSSQADIDLRRNYDLDPQVLADIGPAVTVGRTFMENDELSVGITTHITYRVASNPNFTLTDLIQGKSISPSSSGGQGTHLDFDLGGTYVLPVTLGEGELAVGGAINNLLGGNYSNLGIPSNKNRPVRQPRTYGVGTSLSYDDLGPFTDVIFALEIQDVGNNPNGSMFRTVHLGGEVEYGILAPRLGFNQGYIAAGLGVDLKFLNIDFATYGEEMSLNMGGMQDRRFALRLSFQI